MSDSRKFAEQACRFSQFSQAARSEEEREAFRGIAVGYLNLAKLAASEAPVASETAEASARSD